MNFVIHDETSLPLRLLCISRFYRRVPPSFSFPESINILNAWRRWWLGSVVIHDGKQYQIVPYRHLRDKDLPTPKAKNDLKAKWRPILTKMTETEGLNTRANFKPDDAVLEESFTAAITHLRERFSFLFEMANEDAMMQWSLGTWSKRTQRSFVMKHGTEKRISAGCPL